MRERFEEEARFMVEAFEAGKDRQWKHPLSETFSWKLIDFYKEWEDESPFDTPYAEWFETEKIKMWCDATAVYMGGEPIFGTNYEELGYEIN